MTVALARTSDLGSVLTKFDDLASDLDRFLNNVDVDGEERDRVRARLRALADELIRFR